MKVLVALMAVGFVRNLFLARPSIDLAEPHRARPQASTPTSELITPELPGS